MLDSSRLPPPLTSRQSVAKVEPVSFSELHATIHGLQQQDSGATAQQKPSGSNNLRHQDEPKPKSRNQERVRRIIDSKTALLFMMGAVVAGISVESASSEESTGSKESMNRQHRGEHKQW